ncbi:MULTISPECIES: transporter substrate-binding domain-containing protein [unclassified Klebsiella]|uniref:transporter substrate-binding domain-containing protein n=1 Tax=unclassified Klebsiella TaxID=2608929 RepID=UPI000C2A61E4|nr:MULTISPECIES: transporter substrate-binding domain-containing protein [unclassified Klebsiella]PJX55973.1 amino acid ABC transporter substrate-binding protein [Klebsiella sp. F-Nf9]PKJ69890.1 amino acid ABC transporter substrate-binding protein [Klebsiella sp. X1-16S-Nf21]
MNKYLISKIKAVCVTLAVVTQLSSPAAYAADLVVGANVGYVPFEFQNATGEIVGFEVDLVREVAKRLNRNLEVVNIPFNGLFSAVQSKRIDIAISGITITEKRLASVSFAQPYFDSDQSLSVLATSQIKTVNDLNGKAVGVDTGTTGDVWATANQTTYKIADIRRYEGLQLAMLDLAAGRIDGYVADIPALQYYVKDKPQFKVVDRIPTGEKYSMMFAKDAPLAKEVNDVITVLKQEGYIAKLHQTWFGTLPAESSSTSKVEAMPMVGQLSSAQ